MHISRRRFAGWMGQVAAAWPLRSFGQARAQERLGLNTWSLRALTQDEAVPVILRTMKRCGLRNCQLLFSHVEPTRFSPVFPVGLLSWPTTPPTPEQLRQQAATTESLRAWRLSVPLTYFAQIRSRFEAQGLRIRSYSASLGKTEAEIDRQFLMTEALGAELMIARVPETLTDVVAAAAQKHGLPVCLQFSVVGVLEGQLKASALFRIDPDLGDMTKSHIDPVEFLRTHYTAIGSIDLKDALPGGVSVPFGQGNSPIKEVLRLLQQKQSGLVAYIDCDYAGTGRSVEEVERCTSYARSVLA